MSSIIDYYADVVAYSEDDSFDDFIEEKVGEILPTVTILSDQSLWEALGQKATLALKSLSPLIKFILQNEDNNGVVYISQKVTETNNIFNNSKAYNKWIKRLMDCCCLYRLNIPAIWDERPYYYYINHNNLDRLWEWILQKNIFVDDVHQKNIVSVQENDTYTLQNVDDTYQRSNLRFGIVPFEHAPTLNGSLPNDYGLQYTDDEIILSLYNQYPLVLYYQRLTDKLNIELPQEEKIKFIPKVRRRKNGSVSKISLRATNTICTYTSIEKQLNEDPNYIIKRNVEYREPYLAKRFGPNYKEFDVKASVPRVARAMLLYGNNPSAKANLGNLKEDIYKVIFEQFIGDIQEHFDSTVKEWSEVRKFFKGIFMHLYFGGSIPKIRTSLIRSEMAKLKKKKKKGIIVTKEQEKEFLKLSCLHKDKNILEPLIEKWKMAVDDYCGVKPTKNTEVFFHESCIYLELREILASENIEVVQVYDGFYFKDSIPNDIENYVHTAFANYLKYAQLFRGHYKVLAEYYDQKQ